ncbi:MAG: FG-GAP repeat domain-containing protein, partial [Pyrinomonadaceae bacterium]
MKNAVLMVNRNLFAVIFCAILVVIGLSWFTFDVSSQNAAPEPSIRVVEAARHGSDTFKRYGSLAISADSAIAGEPRAAVTGDFDADGVSDILIAHGGQITLRRGDVNAFAPKTEAAFEAIRDGLFVSPFEQQARARTLPANADFIFAGDFNRDARLDAAVAARGGDAFYVLHGDGRGSFASPRRIGTEGSITVIAVGDVNRADGLADIIVGTRDDEGFGLQIFAGASDVAAAGSLIYRLPSPAEAIAVGRLNENEFADIAIGLANEVIILSGADITHPGATPPAAMLRLAMPAGVRSIVTGDLVPDREARAELAVLSPDGMIRVFTRGTLDTRPVTATEHLAEQVREYLSKGYPVPQRILSRLSKADYR